MPTALTKPQKYHCFFEAAGCTTRQVTLHIRCEVPEVFGCYLHATEIATLFRREGIGTTLEPVKDYEKRLATQRDAAHIARSLDTRPQPAPAPIPPATATLPPAPECAFALGDVAHPRGRFLVAAITEEGAPFELNVCRLCLHDTVESLKDSGATRLIITSCRDTALYKQWSATQSQAWPLALREAVSL